MSDSQAPPLAPRVLMSPLTVAQAPPNEPPSVGWSRRSTEPTSSLLPDWREKYSATCAIFKWVRFGGKSARSVSKVTDIGVVDWSGLLRSYQASASSILKLNARSELRVSRELRVARSWVR